MSAASSVPQRLRRVLFLLVIPALALCALALAGNARADGSTSPPDPSAAAPSGAAPDSSSATTDQGALAGANATQQQPSNVVNSTRVDSPGDNGAITQTNTAQGQAAAANGSATTQAGGSPSSPGGGGGDQGSQLDAATQQAAAAIASAIQQGAQNIVIQIRINSPGDNGPINQTNTANAGAGAVNASQTSQGSGADAAAPTREDGSTPDTASPDGASGEAPPAAPAEPPASAPAAELRQAYATTAPTRPRAVAAATGPKQAYATRTPARPRVESQQTRHEHAAAAGSTRPPAAGADRGQLQGAPSPAEPTRGAAAPVSTIDPHPASRAAAPMQHGAAAAASAVRSAARVFNRIAGPAPVAAESLDQVSNAVVLTLVALIIGVLFFVAYTYAPPALRASGLWLRLRP